MRIIKSVQGFSIVEVLIGILILSLAIMTFSAALRQVYHWQLRQLSFENIYMGANSLIDEIVTKKTVKDIEKNSSGSGIINGVKYNWHCRPFLINHNFEFSAESPGLSGNIGEFKVVLQECMMSLKAGSGKKELSFFRMLYCCPRAEDDNGLDPVGL